jgi:hypothetical protein
MGIQYMQKALMLGLKKLAPEHPDMAKIYIDLGGALISKN